MDRRITVGVLLALSILPIGGSSQARYTVGDTVRGKYASFVVRELNISYPEGNWIRIENINNIDTTTCGKRPLETITGPSVESRIQAAGRGGCGTLLSGFERYNRVAGALWRRLTLSELNRLDTLEDSLDIESSIHVALTLNDDGTVREVKFDFERDNPVWQSVSPDRYGGIERAIIGEVEPHDNDYYGNYETLGIDFGGVSMPWSHDPEYTLRRYELKAAWDYVLSENEGNREMWEQRDKDFELLAKKEDKKYRKCHARHRPSVPVDNPEQDSVFVIFTSVRDTVGTVGLRKMMMWDEETMDFPALRYILSHRPESITSYISKWIVYRGIYKNAPTASEVRKRWEAIRDTIKSEGFPKHIISVNPKPVSADCKPIVKPVGFLSQVELIDFDILLPEMTYSQLQDLWNKLMEMAVYIIDRNDIEGESVTLVPAYLSNISIGSIGPYHPESEEESPPAQSDGERYMQ